MSRRLGLLVLLGALPLQLSGSEAPPTEPFGVGRVAPPETVAERDISVFPDGAGLPLGQGTAKQGRLIYEQQCSACHGLRGEGQGPYPPLAGGRGSLTTDSPLLTVGTYWPRATTVWDHIRRAMPYYTPGSLSADEVYALTAYVLYLDGVVEEDEVLNETTLPRVQMPNRDGFVPDPREPGP